MQHLILKSIIPIFLWTLVYSTAAMSQQIYVDVKGNDANPGNANAPVKTIYKAAEVARQISQKGSKGPIEIIIGAGEYEMDKPLTVTAGVNDFNNVPVVFKGKGAAKPVLNGGYQIKGFVKVSETLWKANVTQLKNGKRFEQLYVNGKRAQRAKSPNNGFYHPVSVTENVIKKGTGPIPEEAIQTVKLAPEVMGQLANISPEGRKDVLLKFYHFWDNTIKPLQAVNVPDSSITMAGKGMKSWNKISPKSLLQLENAMAFLDEPGEWFLDEKDDLYYYPRKGETISNLKCFAPAINQFIVLKGSAERRIANISFQNINFKVSGFNLPNNTFEPSQAAAHVGAAIEIDFAEGINIANCTISQTGANAVWFRRACRDSRITHCDLHDLGAGAVKIGETVIREDTNDLTRNIKVDNNIISSGGRVLPSAVAVIIFNASDNVISHNDISDFFYTGISVGWVWGYKPSPAKRNKITYNHIHNLGQGALSDMGGIYTLGASEGTVLSNNVIHDVSGVEYGGWGLYCDEGSSGITLENNLVYRCGSAGFHQHFGKDNVVKNNIFALNGQGQLQLTRVEKHRSLVFTNNIVYSEKPEIFLSNWSAADMQSDSNSYWVTNAQQARFAKQDFSAWQGKNRDRNSQMLNPGFVNAAAGNFELKDLSAAKKIKFKPFDYKAAGVYGDPQWKSKAKSAKVE